MPDPEFGGGWTEQKLQVLDHYLTAYCKIFQKNPGARHFDTIYVDAFAGSGLIQPSANRRVEEELFGEFVKPDAIEFLKGSAARALQHPFTWYLFIEKSEARVAELEKLKALSSVKSQVVVRKGEANSQLRSFIGATDWQKTRAVVFLDPYGMQVDWDTIEMLGRTKAVDLWLLFPLGQAVMRLLQKKSEPPPEWQQALDRIFGTHEWHTRFYVTDRQAGLFDEEITSTQRVADSDAVGQLMIERLETAFHSVAKKPGVLYNSQNVPLYLFCFASAEPERGANGTENRKRLTEATELNG